MFSSRSFIIKFFWKPVRSQSFFNILSQFLFLICRFSNSPISADSSDNSDLSSKIQENHQYINTLLKYPSLTPAKLSIILNFRDNPDQKALAFLKKRPRAPMNKESKERKNSKRRALPYPRVLKRDIRREYMRMLFNVLNSGDLPMFKHYLHKYFVPHSTFSKSLLGSNNHHPAEKGQCLGIEKIYEFFQIIAETSPDYIFQLQDTYMRVNPKTKHSVLVASFRKMGTRIKFRQSGFATFLSKVQAFPQNFLQSLFAKKPVQATPVEDSNDPTKIMPKLDEFNDDDEEETSQEEVQIQELTENNFLHHYFHDLTPVNVQLSNQIATILSKLSIYQMIKTSLMESDPYVLLPNVFKGIKFDAECMFYMYLDENHHVLKLELFIGQIKLEISTGEFLR